MDITLVKDWLGHVDLKTTSQYIEISIERKGAALKKIPPPNSCTEARPMWKQNALMTYLSNLSQKVGYVAQGVS